VVSCNDATRRLLVVRPDEPIPHPPSCFTKRDVRDIVDRALGGEAIVSAETPSATGCAVHGAAAPQGGAVLSLHDVSDSTAGSHAPGFCGHVSHELKTPLTSISGYADTLLNPIDRSRHAQEISRRHPGQQPAHAAPGG